MNDKMVYVSVPSLGFWTCISGYGGIGRRARFRFWWETVQVQVLLPARKNKSRKYDDCLAKSTYLWLLSVHVVEQV